MKRYFCLVLVLIIMVIFGGSSQTPVLGQSISAKLPKKKISRKAKSKSVRGWVFDVRSDRGGLQSMYLTNDALRFRHKSFSALIHSPDFDAIVFNTTTKKYTKMVYAQWLKRYAASTNRAFKPTGRKKTIAGLKATAFRMPTRKKGVIKEYWMTQDIKIPNQFSTFIGKVLKVPAAKGIPVKIILHRRGKTPIVSWEIVSLKKKPIDKSKFDLPEGFKRVATEMELLIKDEDASGMADLLR